MDIIAVLKALFDDVAVLITAVKAHDFVAAWAALKNLLTDSGLLKAQAPMATMATPATETEFTNRLLDVADEIGAKAPITASANEFGGGILAAIIAKVVAAIISKLLGG